MDRAIASGAIGREFESLRAHQISSRPLNLQILRQKRGSGFRLRAPLFTSFRVTSAKRLKFGSLGARQIFPFKSTTSFGSSQSDGFSFSVLGLGQGRRLQNSE